MAIERAPSPTLNTLESRPSRGVDVPDMANLQTQRSPSHCTSAVEIWADLASSFTPARSPSAWARRQMKLALHATNSGKNDLVGRCCPFEPLSGCVTSHTLDSLFSLTTISNGWFFLERVQLTLKDRWRSQANGRGS